MDYKKAYISLDQLVIDELGVLSSIPNPRWEDVMNAIQCVKDGRKIVELKLYEPSVLTFPDKEKVAQERQLRQATNNISNFIIAEIGLISMEQGGELVEALTLNKEVISS